MKLAVEKQALTLQPPSNKQLEQLSYYLLQEIQKEAERGSKVADEILCRAFARLERENGDPLSTR